MAIEALLYDAFPTINKNEIEPDILENTCRVRLNEISSGETSHSFNGVYSNNDGLTILERLANMEKKIESLRQKSESYEAELGILRLRTGDGQLTNRDDC
jgi:hypothetical protein